jgi:hypothetical protein
MLGPLFGAMMLKEAYKNGERFHVYLSGPMTGLPDYNRPAFDKVAADIRAEGKTVFNPAEVGERDVIRTRSWYMRKDIDALLKSDTVHVLQGWEKSEGAKLEVEIARQLELPIVFIHMNTKKGKKHE